MITTIPIHPQIEYLGMINNLITYSELYEKLINDEGTYKNNEYVTWLSFKTKDEKEILIANKCIDINTHIDFLNRIYNKDTNRIEKVIDIKDNKYLCRIPSNSEWNDLIIRFGYNDISTVQYTICSNGYNGEIIFRGLNDIYELSSYIENIDDVGFRPVLEVL